MLRHYLLIAWRQLRKGPLYSSIHIAGLALGMAVAMLIGLWVWDEWSFDHYHRNHARLGEILSIDHINGTTDVYPYSSVPLAAALRHQYPDDLAAISLLASSAQTLGAADKVLRASGAWVQTEFPVMFSLHMIKGRADALRDPASVLLTASLARSLFGTTDVVGRDVRMGDSSVVHVGGVYEDLPLNSSICYYTFLLSWENLSNPGRQVVDDWTDHHYQLFVQLKAGVSFDGLSVKIRDIAKPHLKGGWEEVALHPMDKWHLYDRAQNGRMVAGRLESVRASAVIGGLVLLLACINFMNLSTARSERRAMETGIRKVLGSRRRQLIGQFLGESIVLALIALLVAIGLMAVSLHWFSGLAGRPVVVPWGSGWWWLIVLGFAVFTGLLAGCYPAFYLSGFRPVRVLKGNVRVGRDASLPRRVLVVVQFAISMALVIGTMIVYRQIQFAKDRPVGYSREGLLTLYIGRPGLIAHADALREELLRTGAIADMAVCSSATTDVRNSMLGYDWEGRDPRTFPVIGTLFVGYEFGRTVGWTIKEGRDFLPGNAADSGALVLNEAAVRFTGLKDPVGKTIRWHQVDHPIVGVVKDMVMESPYRAVGPVFFMLSANVRIQYLVARIQPALPVSEALARMERVFRRWDPADPFDYWFTDDAYRAKFRGEEQVGRLAAVFAVLAIVISCLGLFGLAAFVAEQRTKEMGIRKVLGASVVQLWALMSREFAVLVGIAFCIAAPAAWWYCRGWLQAYEYRVGVSVWVFVAAFVGGMGVALVTVSGQALRVAGRSVVGALRVT